jgi:hypothetical protein
MEPDGRDVQPSGSTTRNFKASHLPSTVTVIPQINMPVTFGMSMGFSGTLVSSTDKTDYHNSHWHVYLWNNCYRTW